MSSIIEATLAAMRREMRPLLETAMEVVLTKARGVLEAAEQRRAEGLAEVAEGRAKGLTELDAERSAGLAEVDARRAELHSEIAAMYKHKEAQEGRIVLNIGGYRFETSVQTLRRVPHTFFDAYFSGRYAQDVCTDGSIFVDRDGEHFGHVLEHMRDGVVVVAEPGANVSASLLRALKREFGFYCIELNAEPEPEQLGTVFVMGGIELDAGVLTTVASMERYDVSSGQWSPVASMITGRHSFGVCAIAGELYAIGGPERDFLTSVEKYTPSTDTWCAVAPIPMALVVISAVSVGAVLYVLGDQIDGAATMFKIDTLEGTWSAVTPLPEPIRAPAVCSIGSAVYVFGGVDSEGDMLASVFKYDTLTDVWSILAPMPRVCTGHRASHVDGRVYIMKAGVSEQESMCFDPVTGVWCMLAPTTFDRNIAAFTLSGCLHVKRRMRSASTIERYDVATDTWTAVTDLPHGWIACNAIGIESCPAEEQDLFDSLIAQAAARRP
jgi:hypothetical protein